MSSSDMVLVSKSAQQICLSDARQKSTEAITEYTFMSPDKESTYLPEFILLWSWLSQNNWHYSSGNSGSTKMIVRSLLKAIEVNLNDVTVQF